MKIVDLKVWGLFTLTLVLACGASIVYLSTLDVKIPFLGIIIVLIFLAIFLAAIRDGYRVIPEKYEYVVEKFGQYIGEPLTAGVALLFPWFGIFYIKKAVPKNQRIMELFLDENIKTGFGQGDIEFADCSAPIIAYFYYRVTNSQKAVYEAADIEEAIALQADSILRTFLAPYKINDAINLRTKFNLKSIACNRDFSAEISSGVKISETLESEYRSSEFYKNLIKCGIEPVDFTISDIILPDNIKLEREKKLSAEQNLEVAKIKQQEEEVNQKTKIIIAEGDKKVARLKSEAEKEARQLKGEGEADRVRKLKEVGISVEEAVRRLNTETIYDQTNKIIFVQNGSSSEVSSGAKFGVGFKEVNE